jgi:hypothetical protein
MKSWKALSFILFLMLPASAPVVFGLDLPGIDISGGPLWIGNGAGIERSYTDENGDTVRNDNPATEPEGGPSPLLMAGGVGLPLEFTDLLSLEPELSFFGTQYQLADQAATDGSTVPKAVPTEIEYAASLWVLTVMVNVPFRLTFHPVDKISLGGGIHTALLFRIPTLGWGGDDLDRASIAAYFYKKLRFYYPGAGFFLNWKFSERLGFHFRLAALFPIFHLWDGENIKFYDQLMLLGRVGLRFYFK